MITHRHSDFIWTDLFGRKTTRFKNLTQILKENVLFSTLTARELNYVSKFVYERIYQPNEKIFQQNDRGLGMYLIVKGRIDIQTQVSNRNILVTSLSSGSFFGEIALIDRENLRSATAIAVERSNLIGFFKPDLDEILERKPSIGVKILSQLAFVLAQRLLETTDKVRTLEERTEDPS